MQAWQWADVRLAERRITVSDRVRRLKNVASNRDVPDPRSRLAQLLAAHRTRLPGWPRRSRISGTLSMTTAGPAASSRPRRSRRNSTDGGRNPSGAPRPNVTIHDLRHTFGVHCAQAGVPIVRLQKLLGHASPHMTLRYMKHAPESYFAGGRGAGGVQSVRPTGSGVGSAGCAGSRGHSPGIRCRGLFPTFFPTCTRKRMND